MSDYRRSTSSDHCQARTESAPEALLRESAEGHDQIELGLAQRILGLSHRRLEIHGLVYHGRYVDRATLDRWLSDAREEAARY